MKIDVLEDEYCVDILNTHYENRIPREFLLISGDINLKEEAITFNLEIDYVDYTVKIGICNFPFSFRKEKYSEPKDFSLELLENALEFYPDSFKWKVVKPKKPARFSVNFEEGRLISISNCMKLTLNEVAWLEKEFYVHLLEPIICEVTPTCIYQVKEV